MSEITLRTLQEASWQEVLNLASGQKISIVLNPTSELSGDYVLNYEVPVGKTLTGKISIEGVLS